MCRSPNYNTVLKQIISPILWKLVKQILVLVDYTHLFLRTLNEKDKWERSFPQRKKSPFPRAHLLGLGQWKSHQGCKSRTMELFALLHRKWMIVWSPRHTVALLHWLVLLGSSQTSSYLPHIGRQKRSEDEMFHWGGHQSNAWKLVPWTATWGRVH